MNPDTEVDDRSLVKAVVESGDLTAFDALVVRHQDFVFGAVHRMVGDRDRAGDLVQETFLRAFRGLSGFAGDAAFSTWLWRIARNVVISAARYDSVRPVVTASLDAPASGDGPPRREPAAPDCDPLDHLLAAERRELVLAAVASLPEDFREVIVLRDFEDRSYEEMAELIEVPVGTVRSRLHRARAELRTRLAPMLARAGGGNDP